jgi:hypothetical protein
LSQLRERTISPTRPLPDEAVLPGPRRLDSRLATTLRTIGAIAILVTGAVHLQQYLYWPPLPTISPLFLLNFVGATLIGLGLLIPGRLVPRAPIRLMHGVLALAGIGLAATSIVFLVISEHQPLFGFHEHGYRAAIVTALAAEAVGVAALGGYLATRARSHTAAHKIVELGNQSLA